MMTSLAAPSLVTCVTLLRMLCFVSASLGDADDASNVFIDDVRVPLRYRAHAQRWSPDHVPHRTSDEPADPCKAGKLAPTIPSHFPGPIC